MFLWVERKKLVMLAAQFYQDFVVSNNSKLIS